MDVKRRFSASIFIFLEINNAIDCQKVCPELFFTPSQMPRQGTGLALLSESAGGVDGLPSPAVAVEGSPLEFSSSCFSIERNAACFSKQTDKQNTYFIGLSL